MTAPMVDGMPGFVLTSLSLDSVPLPSTGASSILASAQSPDRVLYIQVWLDLIPDQDHVSLVVFGQGLEKTFKE